MCVGGLFFVFLGGEGGPAVRAQDLLFCVKCSIGSFPVWPFDVYLLNTCWEYSLGNQLFFPNGGGSNLKLSERAPPHLVPSALFPFLKMSAAWAVKENTSILSHTGLAGTQRALGIDKNQLSHLSMSPLRSKQARAARSRIPRDGCKGSFPLPSH